MTDTPGSTASNDPAAFAATSPSGQVLTTTVNRRWMLKMAAFIAAFIGLGIWGTVDAVWVYPERGRKHAEFTLWKYLEQAQKDGALLRAGVDDPQAEFDRLNTNKNRLSVLEGERFKWLTSLSRIHNLRAAAEENKAQLAKPADQRTDTLTLIKDPEARLNELGAKLSKVSQPKALSVYDIPSQWLFMVIGFAGAAWMILFLVKASRIRYLYEPDAHALTLPDGKRIVPAQIVEVDKRKWHKYFVFLKLNDNSPEIKLDLLRYAPLEDWVLEMEKLHPNYVPEPEEEPAAPQAPAAGETGASGESEPAKPA